MTAATDKRDRGDKLAARRGTGPSGGGVSNRIRRNGVATPWLFLSVALVVTILFSIVPFLQTIMYSFTNARRLGSWKFVGLDNFIEMAHDELFWTALQNSALYVVVVMPAMVFLPLLLALLVQKQVPFIAVFRTGYYVPVIVSMVAAGIMWQWMLDSRGMVNSLLQALGWITSPVPFLTDRWLLLISSMIVTIWKGVGYYMVIYLAALTNIPTDLYEAASIDGAGAWHQFWSVTIPGVRNTMVLIAALSSVAAFRVFTEIYVLSNNTAGIGGKGMTMVMLIQREGTGLDAQVGYSSAISLVMFLITVGLMIASLRMQMEDE
ncbi:carbohydrate ABC transporter permease [Bifidobacterium scardovii]|uniref:carbohydrate ABC transporter permease n=1 Tax=Bifidobacterium scardovii TaxID=158787 RepID=UPI002432678D|nr:sugar ABC transporter permease [Bifidobacterium scardovii]MBS6946777.1 sugar ABC transporter permease [Bifidobacterium scardovii]